MNRPVPHKFDLCCPADTRLGLARLGTTLSLIVCRMVGREPVFFSPIHSEFLWGVIGERQ